MSLATLPSATASALPLAEELTPVPDPWETARRFAHLPHLLFLDSVDRHPERGRYSFVTADPIEWMVGSTGDPFAELARRLARFRVPRLEGLPPFQGGLAGQFGYGLQHAIERIPRPRFDEFRVPDLAVGIYDWVIAWDHAANRAWVISTGVPGSNPRKRAARRLATIRSVLSEPEALATDPAAVAYASGSELAPQFPLPGHPGVSSNFNREDYLAAVCRAIEYVNAGDCFQVNLSQRLLAHMRDHPLDLYGRLRMRNPAPFAGYFDLGNFAIASAFAGALLARDRLRSGDPAD